MSFEARCPMEYSLMDVEGSDRASGSGSKVGCLVVFLLGGLGSGVGSTEGGLLREYLSLESSG